MHLGTQKVRFVNMCIYLTRCEFIINSAACECKKKKNSMSYVNMIILH